MAGEWIPYDVCLPQKPEVLDLVDRTGLEVDQVVGRLLMLWGWSALNSSDGSARMSLRLLSKVCGGDEAFWYAVQDVGWLVIDAENGTVGIPGWDARFSKAAKSRALATVRHQVDKVGGAQRPRPGRNAPEREEIEILLLPPGRLRKGTRTEPLPGLPAGRRSARPGRLARVAPGGCLVRPTRSGTGSRRMAGSRRPSRRSRPCLAAATSATR
jgi:hypothetical protein